MLNLVLPGQWDSLGCWTMVATCAWALGGWWLFSRQANTVQRGWWVVLVGIVALAVWLGCLWWTLQRPPLRTLGETRMWYSILLPLAGWLTAKRWQLRWPVLYCTGMAVMFLIITLLSPESHDKTLMPALQSYWFVPHVVVYMVAYAFLSAASLSGINAVMGWCKAHYVQKPTLKTPYVWPTHHLGMTDNTVQLGFAFLTLGLLFGALWAKEAWGHYWTWDPKETWALLTWGMYLGYIHIRQHHRQHVAVAFVFLVLAFAILMLCWFGVNYMPSAQFSVHTYTKG
jgi:ABC-type transport system involved in cytochrome c biogenesis permease subunit